MHTPYRNGESVTPKDDPVQTYDVINNTPNNASSFHNNQPYYTTPGVRPVSEGKHHDTEIKHSPSKSEEVERTYHVLEPEEGLYSLIDEADIGNSYELPKKGEALLNKNRK